MTLLDDLPSELAMIVAEYTGEEYLRKRIICETPWHKDERLGDFLRKLIAITRPELLDIGFEVIE